MFTFLSRELREGLDQARLVQRRRKSRLRVQVGDAVFPVLRLWHDGMALDAGLTPHLRGLVDVYDGSRLIRQCLIMATSEANGELICSFKRSTAARDSAPLDFWRDDSGPVGYLPKA